jgi:hypothetical protein
MKFNKDRVKTLGQEERVVLLSLCKNKLFFDPLQVYRERKRELYADCIDGRLFITSR